MRKWHRIELVEKDATLLRTASTALSL